MRLKELTNIALLSALLALPLALAAEFLTELDPTTQAADASWRAPAQNSSQ